VGPRAGLENRASTEILSPDRPAGNESLYREMPFFITYLKKKIHSAVKFISRRTYYTVN